MESIHLISASPRRRTILEQMGLPYTVHPMDTEEFMDPAMSPEKLARALAEEKLHAFLDRKPEDVRWAVAADTFIAIDGDTVGKPKDRNDAARELKRFSGRTHQVYTGISLFCSRMEKTITEVEITDVAFRDLTEREVQWYLNTEEWIGVAGSYRIQEKGECLISGINGSYSNVMGLPITRFYGMLTRLNYIFD